MRFKVLPVNSLFLKMLQFIHLFFSLQETLLALAKAVANATASLVLKAKSVAGTTDEPVHQDRVISSATQCALATSQLVACTKVSYI